MRGAGTALSETRLVLEGTAAASRLDGLARIGGDQGVDRVLASLKVEAPDAAVTHIAGWLRPGGALLVGVPNLGSLQARVGAARW